MVQNITSQVAENYNTTQSITHAILPILGNQYLTADIILQIEIR